MLQHVTYTAHPIRRGTAINLADTNIVEAALGFAVAVVCVPWLLGGDYVTRWGVIAIGVPLALPFTKQNLSILLSLVGGLAWAAFATLHYSPDPLGGVLELFYLSLLCLTFMAGASLASLDGIFLGLAAGVAVSAFLSIPQFFGWTGIFQVSVPAGLFFSSEVLAECAAPLLVWCVVKRCWWLAAILLIPIILCKSRVAMFASALGILFAVSKSKKVITTISLLAILLCGVVAVAAFGHEKLHDAGIRVVLWGATIMAFTPFGHGLGWFYAAHPIEQFAHSDVLQAIAELGIGSIFFFIPAVMALTRRNGNAADHAAFVCLFGEAIVSFPLHIPTTGFMAALLAGGLIGCRHPISVGVHDGQYDDDTNHRRTFIAKPFGRATESRHTSFSIRPISAGRTENCFGTATAVREVKP